MTFTLDKAESKEFARWWAAYRNTNEDFSQGFAEQYHELEDVPFCHWIMQDEQRVGGIIKVGSNVGDFFLIAPFTDAEAALKDILSDELLYARNILSEHVAAFQTIGFKVEESRCWMIRPTQPYAEVLFELQQKPVEVRQTDTIAQLMYDAFQGGIGQYGQRDVAAQRESVENFFETLKPDDICFQASSALYDGEKMIAVCLMQPYKSHATVRFVVTHPDYQRRGMAQRLMEYGINVIKDTYDYVALGVTIGNPAQNLYQKMGFVSGAATHTLVRS